MMALPLQPPRFHDSYAYVNTPVELSVGVMHCYIERREIVVSGNRPKATTTSSDIQVKCLVSDEGIFLHKTAVTGC